MKLPIRLTYYIVFISPIGIHWPGFSKTHSVLAFQDYVERIYQRPTCKYPDKQTLSQILLETYTNPLNLNNVTPQALDALSILSPDQLDNFFKHIAKTGPLFSKYELQAIAHFDLETIYLLLPFIFVKDNAKQAAIAFQKAMYANYNSYAALSYETDLNAYFKGLINSNDTKPLGHLDKYKLHLRLKVPSMVFGVVAHKQPGEAFIWDQSTNRYGFNLWSYFLEFTHNTWLKKLIIGHYQVGFGQGLIMGLPTLRNHDIHAIICPPNTGIRPYQGIPRIGLRGLAMTTILKPIEATLFYAHQYLDAKIEKDQNQHPYISSIDSTGKYDSPAKLNKKGTLCQQTIGYSLLAKHHNQQRVIGLTTLYSYYNVPIIPFQSPFKTYLFHGNHTLASSIFYHWLWKSLLFWGELGYSWLNHNTIQQPEYSAIMGTLISLSRYIDLSTALYYYSQGFYAPYGQGFKHYTNDQANEKGWYTALKITPSFALQCYIQYHYFSILRPKPRLLEKSYGYTITSYINYIHQRKTILWLQHKIRYLPQNQRLNILNNAHINPILHLTNHHIKLKIDHKGPWLWWINMELQYNQQQTIPNKTHGYMLAHTEKWQWPHLHLLYKITYFFTQDFFTRLYVYEPHVLANGANFLPYYGHGMAHILQIFWEIRSNLQWISQYKWVYRFQRLETQNDQSGKTKHIIALQLKWLI